MKNTMTDLNNYLFQAIEKISDNTLSEEQFEKELKKASATVRIADTIISANELSFNVYKHQIDNDIDNNSFRLPAPLKSE